MVILYLLAAIAAPAPATPRPDVKRCPDGSTILASQTCVELPDHRYMMNHEPEMKVRTIEWWCRGDKRPSLARLRIRQHQNRDASGRAIASTKTVELITLKVKGGPPSALTVRRLRETLVLLSDADLGGRCLNRKSGGIQSVLTIRGYQSGRRDPQFLDIELE